MPDPLHPIAATSHPASSSNDLIRRPGPHSAAGGAVSPTRFSAWWSVMGILTKGLNLINVSSYYQMVLIGVIIAGAVYVDQWRHNKR